MLRAWLRTPDDVTRERIAQRATELETKRRTHGTWTRWTTDQKMEARRQALKDGPLRTASKLKVPKSTLRDWAAAAKAKDVIKEVGRPSIMTSEEEALFVSELRALRQRGVPLDAEAIVLLTRHFIKDKRGGEADELPDITQAWVQGLRRRLNFGRLRQGTTDRPASTLQDLNRDNPWREKVTDIQTNRYP